MGEWKDDKMHGQGTLIEKGGFSKIVGDFRDNKVNGLGVKIWKSGVMYEGEFTNGIPNGRGVKTWPNGKVFYDTASYTSQNPWPSGTKFIGAQSS